jgi:hypothetical protein
MNFINYWDSEVFSGYGKSIEVGITSLILGKQKAP